MLQKDCHHDCQQNSCPFAQDTHHPNRYVCLKCGVTRDIDKYPSSFGSFILLMLALLCSFYLLANGEKQKNQHPQSACNSPNKVMAYLQKNIHC